jgi:hypothetical protein
MVFITAHAHLRHVVHEYLWRLMSRQGVENIEIGLLMLGFRDWAPEVGLSKLGLRGSYKRNYGVIEAPEFEE